MGTVILHDVHGSSTLQRGVSGCLTRVSCEPGAAPLARWDKAIAPVCFTSHRPEKGKEIALGDRYFRSVAVDDSSWTNGCRSKTKVDQPAP